MGVQTIDLRAICDVMLGKCPLESGITLRRLNYLLVQSMISKRKIEKCLSLETIHATNGKGRCISRAIYQGRPTKCAKHSRATQKKPCTVHVDFYPDDLTYCTWLQRWIGRARIRAPTRSESVRLIGSSRLHSGYDLEWVDSDRVESESGWVTQGQPNEENQGQSTLVGISMHMR